MSTRRDHLISLLILQEMTDEARGRIQNILDTRENGYAELTAEWQEGTGNPTKPTINQLVTAEVDMLVNSGDALREYIGRYEDMVSEDWNNERDRVLAWVFAGDDEGM